ncbi:MAG TPA: hypothetical protein VHI93_04540 [Candidatus Thermoplasmatota archaeon]|nr:hypothetical protein [Candidatus Thermoplasmatota archaeon]
MHLSKVLSVASIAFAALFYLTGVLGLLWPKTDPLDVGLLSTSVLFLLFGLVGLLVRPRPVAD